MPPSTPDPTLWLTDLMAKQQELLKSLAPPGTPAAADPANPLAPWMQAANAFTQWQQQALQQMTMMRTAAVPAGAATPAVDRRFADEAWSQGPALRRHRPRLPGQTELLRKALDTAPLDERSKAQWGFALRQVIDALSPANCLATNPEALQLALETGGESLVEGTRLFTEDLAKGRISMTDDTAFEVGRNVATTPGSVVFENDLIQLIQYTPSTDEVYERPLRDRAAVHQQVLHPRPAAGRTRSSATRWRRATRCSWCRGATPGPSRAARPGTTTSSRASCGRSTWRSRSPAPTRSTRSASASAARCSPARSRCWRRAASDKAASMTLLTTMLDFSDTGEIGLLVDEQGVPQRGGGDRQGRRCSRAASWPRCSPRCGPTT